MDGSTAQKIASPVRVQFGGSDSGLHEKCV